MEQVHLCAERREAHGSQKMLVDSLRLGKLRRVGLLDLTAIHHLFALPEMLIELAHAWRTRWTTHTQSKQLEGTRPLRPLPMQEMSTGACNLAVLLPSL